MDIKTCDRCGYTGDFCKCNRNIVDKNFDSRPPKTKDIHSDCVPKSDLLKLVEDARAKAPGVENPVFDHMIHAGRLDVVKDIDKLLGDE